MILSLNTDGNPDLTAELDLSAISGSNDCDDDDDGQDGDGIIDEAAAAAKDNDSNSSSSEFIPKQPGGNRVVRIVSSRQSKV